MSIAAEMFSEEWGRGDSPCLVGYMILGEHEAGDHFISLSVSSMFHYFSFKVLKSKLLLLVTWNSIRVLKNLIFYSYRIRGTGRTSYSHILLLKKVWSDVSLISEPATLGDSFSLSEAPFVICKVSLLHLYSNAFCFSPWALILVVISLGSEG